jgi:hypothetical protein
MKMDISTLLGNIQEAHQWFAGQAARQINTALTMRNWIIGMYLLRAHRIEHGQSRRA